MPEVEPLRGALLELALVVALLVLISWALYRLSKIRGHGPFFGATHRKSVSRKQDQPHGGGD